MKRRSWSRTPSRLLLALTAMGCTFCAPIMIGAAEAPRSRVEFDRIDFPADQPAAWPRNINRYVPVARGEFEALIEKLKSGPRPAWLKSAHYEAALINETLQSGVMTAAVQRIGTRPALLDLGKVSFALDHLKWQEREAIWGAATDGRTWLLLDGSHDELLGEWSCRGRPFPGGIDFDLQLAPATVSVLDLRIPKGFQIHAPTAEVTLLSGDPAGETQLWRIECGSDSRCHVTLLARNGVEASRSALLVEHDMQVVVREDETRFQLNLYLEALDAPIQELTLKVPAGLVVYSATYGIDTPIPIQRNPDGDGRLPIRLPGPLSGRRRALRLEGIAVQKPGQPIIVPQVSVENSTFDGGKLVVTVQSPLQVRSIRSHGYRQRTTDGESLTFQQLSPDSQLILDVHRSQVSMSGRVINLLDVDEDAWNLSSDLILNSQTGGAYQASCLFPADWEVTDVSLPDTASRAKTSINDDTDTARESSRIYWNVQPQPGGRSLVTMELVESIQPGQMRTIQIQAQRRLPPGSQPVPVPLPQLLNCDLAEVLLAVQVSNSLTPVLSADSRLERISNPGSLPNLPAERPNSERRWFRGDSTESAGTLQLKPRLQPVHVRTETLIEALPGEYRVKYSMHYEQGDDPTDRLLVYLTDISPDIRWTWKGAQTLDLAAVRLPKAQHVEWSLPSKGELWELRLPRALTRDVQIEGIASHRWSMANRPALLYVPQAVDKLAELKLVHADTLDVSLDTDGLKPTGRRQSWWYVAPQVQVDLSLRNPEPTRDFPLMLSMQLRTLMSADANGFDLYRARLQMENGSAQESLRVKLDPTAVIQETLVNGEPFAATYQLGEFSVPGLNATRRDVVEIIYRVPAQANVFSEIRHIIVPEVSARVLGFFWEFGIPPSTRIYNEPEGIRLTRSLPSPSWKEHLLGPLGRAAGEPIFNPLRSDAWSDLLQPPNTSSGFVQVPDGELVAPVEWQFHQALLPEVPSRLTVVLWNSARVQLLSWIVLGLCLITGMVLRLIDWKRRDQFAAYWLGLCLAATFSISAPYSEFIGAAIAGSLIALLIPRPLIRKVPRSESLTIDHHSGGFQATIAGILGGLTLLGISIWSSKLPADESEADEPPSKRPVVYFPVDRNGKPSETNPLAYVAADVLVRWKAMAAEVNPEPEYLISSARYDAEYLDDGNLNLRASYRVHLLRSPKDGISVALPLADVSLPDAESCRVNGRPHAISALPNGKGYIVELSYDGNADAGSAANPTDGLPVTCDIELKTRKTRLLANGLDLRIPPIVNSQLHLKLAEPGPHVDVIGRRGLLARDAESRSLICDLGSATNVQVRWGALTSARKSAKVSVSALQHLDVRPAYSELYFHCVATIDDGAADALEFSLPDNAIVRRNQLRTEDLLRSDVIVTPTGKRRLRFVFDKPRQAPIRIDGVLVLLQREPLTQTSLPNFGLVSSNGVDIHSIQNWWGVSASPDFRLESTGLDPENVTMISTDAYLNAWVDASDPRHPESMIPRLPLSTFEYPIGSSPTFSLVPYQSKRRAIRWNQTGYIGKRRLEWTLTGEIETVQAATFQSVLLVDRRLRIEKISVMENDAERRFRWSESRGEPSRVVIFLNEKPQGKQTITLRGSLPITPGTPFLLPTIRPDDCEILDSKLVLTRDPDIDVAFSVPRDWKSLSLVEEPTSAEGPVALGTFQITDQTARPTIQTSSRHSHCNSRSAVLLRRAEGMGWQLKCRMEMTPEGDSPLRIGLAFPASFTDTNAVTVENAEPYWHDAHDNVRHLDLLLNRGENQQPVVVQLEMTLPEPKESDWELPLPTPLAARNQENVLHLEPGSNWFPARGVEVRIADLPEWCASLFGGTPGNETAYKISKPPLQLRRDVSSVESRVATVRLLDHRLWLHRDGKRSGITQAFLSSLRNQLEFTVPPRVTVTSMFLDEQPLALVAPDAGRLMIPMTDAGTESLLTLTWVDEGDPSEWPREENETFPWPSGIPVERNLVTILPDAPVSLWSRTGLTPLASLDQGLDRLETLLERHAALGDETRASIANRWLLEQLQSRLAQRIPFELRNPRPESLQRVERWNQIIQAINRLESVPEAPPMNWQARILEGPVTDSAMAIRGSAEAGSEIRFWQFDRRLGLAAVSMLAILILVPVLRRTIRIEWSRWLHRHVGVSWFLLAAVWWLFMTPSALGVVLFVVGLIRAAQTRPVPAER